MTCIQTLLDDKKAKLSYDDSNLILSLSIFLPTGKQDEIKFIFEKEEINQDSIIQNLCHKINNMENYINILIKNDQNKDITIKLLKQRIEKLEQKIEKFEQKEKSLEDIKESSILNIDEINILLDEFKSHNYLKNKNIGFKLIYKATRDGNLLTNLLSKCDTKEECIIFLKNGKDQRFGGYTRIGFTSEGKEKMDDDAFVFSLNSERIFKVKKGAKAIYCKQELIGFKNSIYLYDGDLFNNSYLGDGSTYNMKGDAFSYMYSPANLIEIELYQIFTY